MQLLLVDLYVVDLYFVLLTRRVESIGLWWNYPANELRIINRFIVENFPTLVNS